MFYCDPCAEDLRWPTSAFRSSGPCECCGELSVCNEVPSSLLPPLDAEPDSLPERVT